MMIQNKISQFQLMFIGQLLPDAPGEHQHMGQNPSPRPQEYYRGYDKIADTDGQLVLPPPPQGHTFVVTSSLMQMLPVGDFFFRDTF